jgi:hypothetical protein
MRHLTYANLMATLALFLVVAGGTAFAASQVNAKHGGKKPGHGKKHKPKPKPKAPQGTGAVGDDTVETAAVIDGSLRSADLADGRGVTGADLVPGSLSGADLADGSLTGADLAAGSLTGPDLLPGLITTDKLAKGSVGAADLAPGAVAPAAIVPGSLTGADIGTETLTGANIDEASLGRVPATEHLVGLRSEAFLNSQLIPEETAVQVGLHEADGAFTIKEKCVGGRRVISGGPANVAPGSEVIDNGPVGDGFWETSLDTHGASDPFSVVLICATLAGVSPSE